MAFHRCRWGEHLLKLHRSGHTSEDGFEIVSDDDILEVMAKDLLKRENFNSYLKKDI